MNMDLDAATKEAPTLTLDPFAEAKEEIVEKKPEELVEERAVPEMELTPEEQKQVDDLQKQVDDLTAKLKKYQSDDTKDNSMEDYLLKKGVLSGVGEKRFEPDRFVKREEFAQMLYKAFNVPDSDSTFEDVGKNEWFYKPVSACCGAGIIKGVSDSHFGSGASLTRQDACVMLYRLLGEPTVELEAEFADRESAAPYAKNAIDALYSMEVIRGTEDNRFMPQSELTRAQAAMIIYNISERNN